MGNEIFEATFREAQRQLQGLWSQVDQQSKMTSEVWNSPLLLRKWLTDTVSRPVQDHIQQNAPGLLSHIRATHHPDDGWSMWAKKGVWNASVDLVAGYAHLAISPLTSFMRDVATKMPKETYDRLNPATLLVLSMHSDLVRRYFAQRVDQLTTPIQYIQDFRGTLQKQLIGTRGAFANARDHLGQLEGGPVNRTKQLGSIIIDLAGDSIAAKIGVALAIFSVYRIPVFHARTQQKFDAMFPRKTVHGIIARQLPVRFIISRPIARVAGNPVLSSAIITYLLAMSVARTISDSLELQEKHPDIHRRLVSYDRDVVNAPFHLAIRESTKRILKQ